MAAVNLLKPQKGKKVDGSLFFFMILAGAICFEAYKLGLGTFSNPQSGLFPFLTGAILGFLCILCIVINLLPKGPREWLKVSISWRRVVPMLGGLFVYTLVMSSLGFPLATFLLILGLLKWIEGRTWMSAGSVAFGMSIFSYIIFRIWLKVQLPEGFLGI